MVNRNFNKKLAIALSALCGVSSIINSSSSAMEDFILRKEYAEALDNIKKLQFINDEKLESKDQKLLNLGRAIAALSRNVREFGKKKGFDANDEQCEYNISIIRDRAVELFLQLVKETTYSNTYSEQQLDKDKLRVGMCGSGFLANVLKHKIQKKINNEKTLEHEISPRLSYLILQFQKYHTEGVKEDRIVTARPLNINLNKLDQKELDKYKVVRSSCICVEKLLNWEGEPKKMDPIQEYGILLLRDIPQAIKQVKRLDEKDLEQFLKLNEKTDEKTLEKYLPQK